MSLSHIKFSAIGWLLCLLLTLPCSLDAQTDAVARVDSPWVETGDTFLLHLAVPFTAGTPGRIDFSSWSDSIMPPGNVLRQTPWSHVGQFWMSNLTLITFDSALLTLPSLGIQLSGNAKAVTNPVQLRVYPAKAPVDPSGLADIKDIKREPAHWTDYLIFILLGLAVVLLVGAVLFFRNRKKQAVYRQLMMPPHELALEKLARLDQQQLWQKGRVKEYYAELTYILREYLQRRFEFPALESTSDEVLRDLGRLQLSADMETRLEGLLSRADLAKFAKFMPADTYHQPSLLTVREFVQQTMPKDNPL